MKASDYIARHLAARGVPCVFELVGGMITHIVDSLHRDGRIRIVSMHHEQGAAFAAEGLARVTGIPGVALATSGPGATNLLTGIGSCHFDSTPAVFITGQVNRHEMKGERAVRQSGFQETDIVSMARPITKAAWHVLDPATLPQALERAFHLARTGRPGPVLLDIPMDVQRLDIDGDPERVDEPARPGAATGDRGTGAVPPSSTDAVRPQGEPAPAPSPAELDSFLLELGTELARAERPLLLAGGGIRSARCGDRLASLAERLGVPVVHSLMAVDVLPFDHPLRIGMIGSYGNRWANIAIGRSDLIVVLGSRLDVRQTGADTASFRGSRHIFHVDCEAAEMNNRVTGCSALVSELAPFLDAARSGIRTDPGRWLAWREEIARSRRERPDTAELSGTDGINPNVLMHQLSRRSAAASAYVVDVGQHQMWAAQSLELTSGQRFLTSGGMGSMGFALPAAVGACLGAGGAPAVLIAGDGGFQCNLQELQTVVRNRLPLKMVVVNNGCLGMVRQFQQSYFKGRYQSTLWGYSAPDFAKVAEAFGVPGRTLGEPGETEQALDWLWQDPAAPALLQVMVDAKANAYPKMAFGKPISEMEPDFQPLEMEGT